MPQSHKMFFLRGKAFESLELILISSTFIWLLMTFVPLEKKKKKQRPHQALINLHTKAYHQKRKTYEKINECNRCHSKGMKKKENFCTFENFKTVLLSGASTQKFPLSSSKAFCEIDFIYEGKTLRNVYVFNFPLNGIRKLFAAWHVNVYVVW